MPLLTFKTKTYSFDIPDNITTMEECESAFSGLVDLQILLKSEYNQMFKVICSETLKINTIYDDLQSNKNNDMKIIVNKNNNVKKIVNDKGSTDDEHESTETDSDSISEPTKKTKPKSIKKNVVPEIKTKPIKKDSVIKKKKSTKKID